MARIRSVHPGLFTDEAFVSVSDAAQIFYVGLLTEADDQGVFEWKPLTLKMRLRPAALSPVDGLLEELERAEKIARFEIDGRHYGAIRNFRRYQRPKSPNAIHPTTAAIRNYTGLSAPISEIDHDEPPPLPPEGEKPPQMEDGGDKREEVGRKKPKLVNPETVARALRAPAVLAFKGAIIRLTQEDFDRWKSSFSAIPDLAAELETIDAKFVDEGFEGKWFGRTSGWLRARHEELLRRKADEDDAYRGVL